MSAILFTTGKVSDTLPADWVGEHFDLRPAAIIGKLRLRSPITSSYGRFGREGFPWEKLAPAHIESLQQWNE